MTRIQRAFRRVLALRAPILVAYALLVPAAVALAARIPSDASIGRLLVESDPDTAATRAFQAIFPEGQTVLLLLEAPDPFAPRVLDALARLEADLRAVPGAVAWSALDVYRRAHPASAGAPVDGRAFRAFVDGARFFRRQGLVGDGFVSAAVTFPSGGPAARDRTLAAVDAAVARLPPGSVERVRRVGAPYVEAWIERESGRGALRGFPLFGLFVVGVALFLYRSWRALLALLLALGAAVALAAGAGRLLGFSYTVVSAVVPLTVLVTALANLVYLHSRFVDQPEPGPLEPHQLRALENKLLPVTASTLAAVLGFAALAVSPIRPVREMGIWTAVGLALSWVVCFTLFPCLQRALRTPTDRARRLRSSLYDRLAAALPAFSFRHRRALLAAPLALAAAGLLAVSGVPGWLSPMRVGVDALDYLDPASPLRRDMQFFRERVAGLNVAHVWIRTPPGRVTDPELLRGLDRLTTAIESDPDVSSVVGPTSFLRLRSYLAGTGEGLPQDPDAFARRAGDVEQLLLSQPELRAFLSPGTLADAQLTVVFKRTDAEGYRALAAAIREAWDRTVAADPAFAGAGLRVVGEGLLQAKVGASLVPTLAESFALTAALIFLVFLAVFRSASARLLAMIPSVFAILATFLGMRLAGTPLNVATLLIATTVLGTTENDQIHFFHHLQEAGPGAGTEGALRHALRVAGRAMAFATLINAAGFLGLAPSSFPPLRQFGVVTAAAFLLALLADLTALPASLWLLRGDRPAPRAR